MSNSLATTNPNVITHQDGQLMVPDTPIIPYIQGDGIGIDITPVMLEVVDAAVQKAYKGKRKILWTEIYCGEKAAQHYQGEWFPEQAVQTLRDCKVGIKGPLTTPIGGGFKSLNVALRQQLDLYTCLRPIRWIKGVPTPVKRPSDVNITLFRENTEDIYTGIEWEADSVEVEKLHDFLKNELGVEGFSATDTGVGLKPISRHASKRLMRSALRYAIEHKRDSITIVHKGNIMKYTEGAFLEWCREVAIDEYDANTDAYGDLTITLDDHTITVNEYIADAMFQQILLSPKHFDVIVTTNLNGDYFSDALAAQVGGVGIAPGANIGDDIAIFEPTHGTAPRMAGLDKANPTSLLLSAEMMLRYIGWDRAADYLFGGIKSTISNRILTEDLSISVPHSECVSCSEFGRHVIKNLKLR